MLFINYTSFKTSFCRNLSESDKKEETLRNPEKPPVILKESPVHNTQEILSE